MSLSLISTLLAMTFSIYIWTGLCLIIMKQFKPLRPRGFLNVTWKIHKWPAFLYVISAPVLDTITEDTHHWWMSLLYVWNGYLWWYYRNAGDDDDWKKKLRELGESVKQLGHRLVIVPEAA